MVVVQTVDEVIDSGDVYRVLVNVVDADNYHFAEFVRNGTNTSILRIGVTSGGADTILATDTIDGLTNFSRDIAVIIAPNEFCASVTNATYSKVIADEDPLTNGFRGGLGISTAGVIVDNFRLEKHYDTDPNCALCICPCQGEYMPPILNLNIVGTGRLSTMDCDVDLVWDRVDQYWKAEFMCCGQFWSIFFFCPELPDYDPLTAKLIIDIGCNSSDGIGDADRLPFNATCDPLLFEFGPYTVTSGDLACGSGPCAPDLINGGTYSITITEKP